MATVVVAVVVVVVGDVVAAVVVVLTSCPRRTHRLCHHWNYFGFAQWLGQLL